MYVLWWNGIEVNYPKKEEDNNNSNNE